MKSSKVERLVNLIGGPYPLRWRTWANIEITDNSLFTIWPLDILLPSYNDAKPYARYLFWLPGQYIWAGYASELTVMNRIRVDKDVEGLIPKGFYVTASR